MRAIHSSYDCNGHNRALIPPVYQNSMFALYGIGEQVPYRYSRLNSPTYQVLEGAVAGLEHSAAGFAFSSGTMGIDVVWRTFLQPGDALVAVADTYGGAYGLLVDVYQKWGVNVIFADLGNPDSLGELLRTHNVKLVWSETPSDPFLCLADIKVFAEKAKAAGVLVGIDSTFTTPYLQQPLDMGYDFVFHSATKYLYDHSDVLMGTVVTETKKLVWSLYDMMVCVDAVAGPVDYWLVLRGVKTLALRMSAHYQDAPEITRRLEAHSVIEEVFYPGLLSREYYELAKTQMPKGIGGVVTVHLKNDTCEAANSVTKSVKLVKIASSLGGVESLISHYYSQSHSGMPYDVKMEMDIKAGLLCSSVGIEDMNNIWSDISKALDTAL